VAIVAPESTFAFFEVFLRVYIFGGLRTSQLCVCCVRVALHSLI
jgi:hypothetical protein